MGDKMDDQVGGEDLVREALMGALQRIKSRGGSLNRLTLQGDRGFIVVSGSRDEDEVQVSAAAGRCLDRRLSESEAQRLYELGFRRKNAALPYVRESTIDDRDDLEEMTQELLSLCLELYASSEEAIAIHERFGDRVEVSNPRLIEAMRRLSKERDMSSRQKVYWAVVRSEVLLALSSSPPQSILSDNGHAQWVETGLKEISHISSSVSLRDFKSITNYRSAAIFSDLDALDLIDPRGCDFIKLPGRLAILLALSQNWDSLLINPRSDVGGELYRNELASIRDGLKQMGW